MRQELGWTPRELTEKTAEWLQDHIIQCTKEKEKVQEITENRLLEAYRKR